MQTFVIQHKCGFKAAQIRLKVLEKSDLLSVFGAQCACQMSFHLMIACKDSLTLFDHHRDSGNNKIANFCGLFKRIGCHLPELVLRSKLFVAVTTCLVP